MRGRGGRFRVVALALAVVPPALLGGLADDAASLPEPVASAAEERTHGPDGLELYRPRGQVAAAPYDVDEAAPWAPEEWDGALNTADQADLVELPTVHAVYVYPADKLSRFREFAAMFQADARQATGVLASLYGRGIRFDERLSADATTVYLDITEFKSKYRSGQLGGRDQFKLVAKELAAHQEFDDPDKKYAVWLDASSRYCGQANLSHDTQRAAENQNELRTTAIVYRPYDAKNADGGFCRGRTLLHELGHNLGALQEVAPNAFDGAHCDDSAEDAMCYTSETSSDTGGPAFDWGNDDYWDPAAAGGTGELGWWAVNLSRFVCPASGCADESTPNY